MNTDYPVVYDSGRHAAGTISRQKDGYFKARRKGDFIPHYFKTRDDAVSWILEGATQRLLLEVQR